MTAVSAVSRQRVRPRHCDAQAIVHASRYYEFFEDAFLDWLTEHVGGYQALRAAGIDMVVVASGCEHRRPATLDDLLVVEASPKVVGRSSLTMSFTVRRENGTDEDVLAQGSTTYVCVATPAAATKGSGGGKAMPMPDLLRRALNC